jgi:AraC family transcriptional activator of pobA
MLEARRNLQYTRMTVTQLSDYLGLAMPPIFLAFSAAIAVCRLKHLEKQLKIMLHNFQPEIIFAK